jgi:flagellar biosynthesis/type III secretory pathway M-ring protein FliF/YscJ
MITHLLRWRDLPPGLQQLSDAKHHFDEARSDNDTPGIEDANKASTATFVTALWLNAAVFAVELLAFAILRRKFKAIYEPRTYIPPEE